MNTRLALVPLACGLGMATHIAGDMLTVEGCPVASPLDDRHYGLPRPLSFTTGTWRESAVGVVLVAALGWLAFRAADPSGLALVVGHLRALAG